MSTKAARTGLHGSRKLDYGLATVAIKFDNGYIVAGLSLRETENLIRKVYKQKN
ncbi:hypothetical protein [Polycladomyces subterraneus]|uniref:Uncharacterized protein n=1 Tax=Polycladomyces subterraneus TaxID=1016997 RepID=A0ABT8IKR0_9BACL|nr:hypothetical protein [Polycladomyces subterraneus]MDN4593376.1 hypothetical protein [Polycladomyces subterraneus]